MTEARIYGTRAGAMRLSAAIDAATDSGRKYTSADLVVRGPPDKDGNPGPIVSGTVSYSGGGRHVPVEDLQAKPYAHVMRKGTSYAYPWSAEVAKHTAEANVPDAPNGTIDETWDVDG